MKSQPLCNVLSLPSQTESGVRLDSTPVIKRRTFLRSSAQLALAGSVLGSPAFVSGAPRQTYDDHLKRLTQWVVAAIVPDDIELLSNLPSGETHGGNNRDDLKQLCWLQNCNLFGFHALREFEPDIAKSLEKSYRRWYEREFPDVEERTENYLPVGKLPAHLPPAGMFYRTVVKKSLVNGYTIGTETYKADQLGTIHRDDPRGLLKFGALGSHLRNDKTQARKYFQDALAMWDGIGFRTPRRTQHDAYYTRYLAYALLVEKALHEKIPTPMKAEIQARLWSLQDKDGGLWTNYNRDGSLPHFAKKTTEIGPLTLLAYCDQIWP